MEEQLVDCRPSPLLSVHGLNPALSELRSVHLNEVRLAAQYCSPMIGTLSNPSCFYPTLSNPGCSEVFEAGTRRPSPLSLPHIFTLAAHQPTRPQMLSGKIEPKNGTLIYILLHPEMLSAKKSDVAWQHLYAFDPESGQCFRFLLFFIATSYRGRATALAHHPQIKFKICTQRV